MRFAVLDGWRGVCALVVALHHFHADGRFFHLSFVRGAWLFVDFFFVLSGFVIAHAYGRRLTGAVAVPAFVARRLGRLWPLHAAVLAALVVLEAAKAAAMALAGIGADNPPLAGETAVEAIGTNLLLIHALGVHDRATWNFPSWSISTEFWTYLVFAALCLPGWTRRPAFAVAVAALGAAVVAWWSPEWLHAIHDVSLFRCIYGFFIGVAVHGLVASRVNRPLPAATVLELAAVALVVAYVAANVERAPPTMAAPVVFGIAVAVFAFGQGAVSRLLLTNPAQALGRWSYSIYMVHTLVLAVVGRSVSLMEAVADVALTVPHEVNGATRVLLVLGDGWSNDLAAAAYLAVVVVLSAFTWRWIERPGQAWVEARLAQRVAAPAE